MLIYEKKVDGVRHLFGTTANVPSNDDAQLTYKDIDGDTITPTLNDTYLDDGEHGIIRKSDDKFVAVYIGNTNVIPGGDFTPHEKVFKKIAVTTRPTTTSYNEGDTLDLTGMVVTGTYEDGDKTTISEYTTSPASGAALTTSDTKITVTVGTLTCTTSITVTQ